VESGPADLLVVGRLLGAHGVRGWVRVISYCDPPDQLLRYSPWHVRLRDRWTTWSPAEGRAHGKGVVARLDGCGTREEAQAMGGADVAVRRAQLPPLGEREYYWSDLIGLCVEGRQGVCLGEVRGLIETGANDVLVVGGERERLIPFVLDSVVLEVDLAAGRIRVDWDPDY
jgi:16S rRNA processing protein RimM